MSTDLHINPIAYQESDPSSQRTSEKKGNYVIVRRYINTPQEDRCPQFCRKHGVTIAKVSILIGGICFLVGISLVVGSLAAGDAGKGDAIQGGLFCSGMVLILASICLLMIAVALCVTQRPSQT